MKRYLEKNENLKESSLSRIVSKFTNHDTGTITANRSEFTNKENKARNFSLKQKLLHLGYGITEVEGGYIENFKTPDAVAVGEYTFFIEDLKDKGKLKQDLIELGENFDQDSIMYIPKVDSLVQDKKGILVSAYIIGTKNNPDAYFQYLKEYEQPFLKIGKDDYQYFSEVSDRPFSFIDLETITKKEMVCPAGTNSGRYGQSLGAKKHWNYYLDRFK